MDDIERVEVSGFRVPFRDIDMYGRMHNAAYIVHAEEALAHFWRYRPPLEGEPHFVASKIECRFHDPLRLDDEVRLTVHIDKIGGKSVGFNVTMEAGNRLAAEIEMLWTATDPDTGEPVPLPEDIRDWLYGYLP
ncbi:acyl-CoA thioesterase [Rhizobium cremeum]|uniref:acyl-CoA thioesterase n=1 Tax=Rhizobium cremeum TaxID=2813827 RepID=UPI000DDFA6A4